MNICSKCAIKLNRPIPENSCGVCQVCGESTNCKIKMRKDTYTHKEVEALISRIINQDSFGDIHYEAGKVQREYGMNFDKEEEEEEPNEEEVDEIDRDEEYFSDDEDLDEEY